MPRLTADTPRKAPVVWGDFTGGVKIAEPELLQPNQLHEAHNCSLNISGELVTREVLNRGIATTSEPKGVFVMGGDPAVTLIAHGSDTTIKLYRYSDGVGEEVGTLSGSGDPRFESWGDDDVLIASGGKLQIYSRNDNSLITCADSPNADVVCTQDGRAVVASIGSDRIDFSGVGDAQNWQQEDNGTDYHTDEDSQWIEAGYKDGCDVVSMVQNGKSLVIFKSGSPRTAEGRIYALNGTYPSWEIQELSRTSRLRNADSVVCIGNDIVYLDDVGVQVLSSVISEGDLRTGSFSAADAGLNPIMNDTCRMWRITGTNRLLVKPKSDHETLWCIDGTFRTWTTWSLPGVLTGISRGAAPAHLFFEDENRLYTLNSSGARDEFGEGYEQVDAVVEPRGFFSSHVIAVSRLQVSLYNKATEDVMVTISIGPVGKTKSIPYTDPQQRVFLWCNLLRETVFPKVEITGGNVSIRNVAADCEEVSYGEVVSSS